MSVSNVSNVSNSSQQQSNAANLPFEAKCLSTAAKIKDYISNKFFNFLSFLSHLKSSLSDFIGRICCCRRIDSAAESKALSPRIASAPPSPRSEVPDEESSLTQYAANVRDKRLVKTAINIFNQNNPKIQTFEEFVNVFEGNTGQLSKSWHDGEWLAAIWDTLVNEERADQESCNR